VLGALKYEIPPQMREADRRSGCTAGGGTNGILWRRQTV
jgi:hypothetical protein